MWNFSARLCASVAAEYTSPYLTSQTAPISAPKSSWKYAPVTVAALCCMCPCWHTSTPWKMWYSVIQNHPCMLRVTPLIYKASDRFTDSTTEHQSSQKIKVNWKLFQGHFLVFPSFLPSGTLFNIRIFLRFPYSSVLKHEFQGLLIYPKYLVQWIVLFTLFLVLLYLFIGLSSLRNVFQPNIENLHMFLLENWTCN